jgi:glycosyltransferase involved in cell wall biosynthesis
MLTPGRIARWLAAGRSIAWTLHDFWPMTGGCHYPTGCEQYRTACLKCPQLDDESQIVANAFAEKRAGWGPPARGDALGRLVVVAPSRFLADRARESTLLGGARVEVIRNAVETAVFAPPVGCEALRAAFGVGPDDLVLLFGSMDNSERRKGAAVLAEALGRARGDLVAALPPGGRVVVLLFGRSAPAIEAGADCVPLSLGAVEEDAVLADALGIADLACIASLEENYPNVILEAMACGTPSIGFSTGGVPEMIEDGLTGVLVPEVGEAEALAAGLVRFARHHRGDAAMRAACRARVEAENSLAAIGTQHRALYEGMLAEAAPMARRARPGAAAALAEAHGRAARAFANAAVAPDLRPGPDLLRYPLNLLLRERAGSAGAEVLAGLEVEPAPTRPDDGARGRRRTPRLLALRTHHAHHAARSGPYQFLRHLPAVEGGAVEVEAMAVPLGHAQLGGGGPWAESCRAAGRLLGAEAFGQQGNAWLAEAEVLARCGAPDAPDLVHFIDGELGGWLAPSLLRALAVPGRPRPRLVATFHQPPALLARMISPALLGALDAVVVLCATMREALAPHLPTARIAVIPHGIDAGFFTPGPAAPRAPEEEEEGVLRLLAVGHWLRDIDAMLDALAMVRAGGLDARLRVVSHNPPPRLAALPEGVTLCEGLSDEALRQAYHDADALFLPLADATANNAVLEAMACGRPVVSTAVGGVPEMVGDDGAAGLLCPPGDPRALAEALRTLAADPARAAAMGRAGRARAEALDWPRIAERHAALYGALLAEARVEEEALVDA